MVPTYNKQTFIPSTTYIPDVVNDDDIDDTCNLGKYGITATV